MHPRKSTQRSAVYLVPPAVDQVDLLAHEVSLPRPEEAAETHLLWSFVDADPDHAEVAAATLEGEEAVAQLPGVITAVRETCKQSASSASS